MLKQMIRNTKESGKERVLLKLWVFPPVEKDWLITLVCSPGAFTQQYYQMSPNMFVFKINVESALN